MTLTQSCEAQAIASDSGNTIKTIIFEYSFPLRLKLEATPIEFMEAQPREIRRYIRVDGKIPFADWIDSMRDQKARLKIKLRLDRVEEGNLGDYRSVGEGVFELRLNYCPGYRVYFGQVGLTIILLLCGGDQNTQVKDIQTPKKYWRDYNARNTSSNQ